jgi:hypothetical protein
MPLQNRVAPDASLHAVAERGLMLGNRGGRFHRPDKTLGRRRWASRHWICCELHYKGWHHEPMGQGYTSLFFLDEVTALSAGHRPCFMCRNAEAKTFLNGRKVDAFDRALHAERLSRHEAELSELPDGAMVEWQGSFHAIRNGRLLRWSHAGYVAAALKPSQQTLRLLTPPLIVQILHQGYRPRWHPTADQWEAT